MLMIINNLSENKIKILIDEVDLNNLGIELYQLISNPSKSISNIKKILYNSKYLNQKINIKSFSIFTYNYKIFSVLISF